MPAMTPGLPETLPAVEFVGQASGFPGYAYGLQQPALTFSVRVRPADPARLSASDEIWSRALGIPSGTWVAADEEAALERILHWSRKLLESTGHPVFADPRILLRENSSPDLRRVVFPCFRPKAALGATRFVASVVNRMLGDSDANPEVTEPGLLVEAERIKRRLFRSGAQGFNPTHFLQAAHELGIPWVHLVGNVIQFGQGARARWLDSSFTDATPNISTQLARNKNNSATLLRLAGIPVPAHFLAASEEAALRYAVELGYPVVVKPADLDGGKAVAAHLVTPEAVRKAFAAARQASRNVLVEKHVAGRDYRVQVVQGEIQGVLERIPGGVTGSGQDTVRILLERQNEERRTATDDRRYLHAMAFDEEAELLLAAQGLSWESVPDAGRVVRLRGAANVTNGGVPVPVPLDRVHPDNLLLARRAARALRLDVAGIDLLIPDIGHSWLQSGAFICEVNAQPQMFTTMHRPMLQRLLKGNGRVPVIVFLDATRHPDAVGGVCRRLADAGLRAGLASPDGVSIAGQRIAAQDFGAYAGGRMLLHDPTVEAIVIQVADRSVLRQGWPIDRCDVLVLGHGPAGGTAQASAAFARLAGFARSLSPRHVIVAEGTPASAALARLYFGKHPGLEILPVESATNATQDKRIAEAVLKNLA
jgi:cyanophycin synthetase